MARFAYDVIKCEAGAENLQDALNGLLDEDREIISVLPDHGGSFIGALGSGQVFGYLIVLRRPALGVD